MSLDEAVVAHYGRGDLLERIEGALRATGKDPLAPTVDDLAGVDEFHARGREATVELAELLPAMLDTELLDIGSGLGGPARFIAANRGHRVVGVDLTPKYVEAANELTRRCGLGGRARFLVGNALALPFDEASFAAAYTQHVAMNIADKPRLYREIARVLRPGGRFVFHDILAGPGGAPHFPVHWANEPGLSFLIAPDDLRALLESSGFKTVAWRDTTEIATNWFFAAMERRRKDGVPALGLHLLLGETAAQKVQNVARNLTEKRLTVYQGLLEKTN